MKLKWQKYPTPVSKRIGIKVSWYTYHSETEARECAKAALNNAEIQRANGYDFGYCAPGFIEKKPDGFEVTIP